MKSRDDFAFAQEIESIRPDNLAKDINELREVIGYPLYDKNGETFLRAAMLAKRFDIVSYLIDVEKKEDVHGAEAVSIKLGRSSLDRSGRTLLHAAVTAESYDWVEKLISNHSLRINGEDISSITPLMDAISLDDDSIARLLLNRGAKVENSEPLYRAVCKGNSQLVNLIVSHDDFSKDKSLINKKGKTDLEASDALTPFQQAARTHSHSQDKKLEYKRIMASLVKKEAKVDFDDHNPLHTAIRDRDKELISYLVDVCKVNINQKEHGKSALYLAVEENHIDIANSLINSGAEVCSSELLCLVARKGETELFKKIIEAGTNKGITAVIDKPNNEMETPLYLAAKYGHFDIVKFLVDEMYVYPSHVRTDNSSAPFYGALINTKDNKMEMLNYFISKMTNEDINEEGIVRIEGQIGRYFSITPVGMSIYAKEVSSLKKLLEDKKAHPIADETGQTLLSFAAAHGVIDALKYLIEESHVDINEFTDKPRRWTALHYAASRDQFEAVQYLLEQGAEFRLKTREKDFEHTPVKVAHFNYSKSQSAQWLRMWELHAAIRNKPLFEQLKAILSANISEDKKDSDKIEQLIKELEPSKNEFVVMQATIKKHEETIGSLRAKFIERYVLTQKTFEASKIAGPSDWLASKTKFFKNDKPMPRPVDRHMLVNEHAVDKEGLIERLQEYILRIEEYRETGKKNGNDIYFGKGFFIMEKSRTENRIANYHLARDLLSELTEGNRDIQSTFSEENINDIRNKYPNNRVIHSSELNSIIEDARRIVVKNNTFNR